TDAELDQVTAGMLKVGDANSGNMNISGAINPANAASLSLQSGGTISQAGGSVITEANLALRAVGAVTLTGNNDVNNLSASVTGAGNGFSFSDADDLMVTTVDNVSGVATANGAISISTGNGALT